MEGEKFQVFAINCAHLGCPVRCCAIAVVHVSVPRRRLLRGRPAPRPLPRGLYEYNHKIENGELLVQGGFIPTLARPLSTA
jgi:hypothetical protein